MKPIFFDSAGKQVHLGRILGVGGEGAVHEILNYSSGYVAKIYKQPIAPVKQKKLILMSGAWTEELDKVATWPITTLHDEKGVRGFIMRKLSHAEPIHKLYSPAHRKQVFPKANWAFLVSTAKNLAAVFHVMHTKGHIVGDVNQGNIYVANDSTVKLIDCDSFQVSFENLTYSCDVGVAHFTPPEMQRLRSYQDYCRTEAQDNFGLAVLCFHLLFMGRHPFSGVHASREDICLEKAIERCEFAFSINAGAKGISPPPNCVPMDIVTPEVRCLFETAFSEESSRSNQRPTAQEWYKSLNALQNSVVTCCNDKAHVYYYGLPVCPWCALERSFGVLFFVGSYDQFSLMSFDLEQFWQRVLLVQSPGTPPFLDIGKIDIAPKPLPPGYGISCLKQLFARILGVVIISVSLFYAVETENFCIIAPGVLVAVILYNAFQKDLSEKRKRKDEMKAAEIKWKETEQEWLKKGGDSAFKEKLQYLEVIKSQYKHLPSKYAKEKQTLQSNLRKRQLEKYLSSFHILSHKISNIGESRKAVLLSFGVETAADIEENRILRISGFGFALTAELLVWRKSIESNFVFDPSKGIDRKDLEALNHRYKQEERAAEGQLKNGLELLIKAREDALEFRSAYRTQLETIAREFAQARANLSIF